MNDLTNTAVTNLTHHLHAAEFGRFKLKSEVTAAQALAAYQHMVEQFLSQQPDWQGQQLIQLEDGSFIDLAFSRDLNGAKQICNAWMQQPVCLAFLQLIEPISIEFGTVIYCKPAI